MGLFVVWLHPCRAQQRTVERVYISTDRDLYVAGESVWISLYCFDMSNKETRLSELSSVAYVELRSAVSLASTAKISIDKGRGSGKIDLSPSLPTGNYRLIAYTKQMLNEDTLRYFDKIIPVYNTLSTERVPDNVEIKGDEVEDIEPAPFHATSGHVDVQWKGDKIVVENKSDRAMTLHISISRIDIPAAPGNPLQDFLANHRPDPAKIKFVNLYTPEYEGEIIRGRVKNIKEIPSGDRSIFLSTVGSGVDIYSAVVDGSTGEFAFFTPSFYGNREMALEYPAAKEATFELFDPFIKPPIKPIPPLYLDKQYAPRLVQRSIEMQLNHRFGMDTLHDRIAVQDAPPICTYQPFVYVLDHYTRFPTFLDIVIEFVSGARFRKVNNKTSLQILVESDFERGYTEQSALVMIDGIAVFDHDQLPNLDLLKVRSVSVYNRSYRVGNQTFDGIVLLHTYKGNYPDLTLGKNALIVDYEGVQYPVRCTGGEFAISENRPDIRSLLYWDPQVDLALGEKKEIRVQSPYMPEKYAIVLEGTTVDGQAVYYRSEFVHE